MTSLVSLGFVVDDEAVDAVSEVVLAANDGAVDSVVVDDSVVVEVGAVRFDNKNLQWLKMKLIRLNQDRTVI